MGRLFRKLFRWNSNPSGRFYYYIRYNKKIEEQKKLEKEQLTEEKKYAVRPYLDTRYIFFNEDSEFGLNDRVFDINEGIVEKVRYGFTSMNKKCIKMRQSVPNYIYLKYIIRNIGAGSAVDKKVSVNGFSEKISIAKEGLLGCGKESSL